MGMAAMQQPVFAQIVKLPQTMLPVAGTVYNGERRPSAGAGSSGSRLVRDWISGANFLFAATATVDAQQVTLYGSVMGQPTLDTAFTAARALIGAMAGRVASAQGRGAERRGRCLRDRLGEATQTWWRPPT